jgi:hypothetical protein
VEREYGQWYKVSCGVMNFSLVAWTLPDGVTHVQRTLPSPCIHLVFDAGRTAVFGVMTGSFEYTLKNSGRVLGVRFWPGALRGFLGQPVQSITDRELKLSQLFDCDRRNRLLDAADQLAGGRDVKPLAISLDGSMQS